MFKINKVKAKFISALSFPGEYIIEVPKITMYDNNEMILENYRGLAEYNSESIRVNTVNGIYRVYGSMLEMLEIDSSGMIIKGKIEGIEIKGGDR